MARRNITLSLDEEAQAVRRWLDERGVKFVTGTDEATELTDAQKEEVKAINGRLSEVTTQFSQKLVEV